MDDLEQIIEHQAAELARVTAENLRYREDLGQARSKLHSYERDGVRDPYWTGVYDRIRAAWDKRALAELGTASPSPLDLEGRPELAGLWGCGTVSFRRKEPNLIRDDGTFWASGYDPLDITWMHFAFWRMVRNPDKKWFTPWRDEWVSTGEVWKGKTLKEGGFTIIR